MKKRLFCFACVVLISPFFAQVTSAAPGVTAKENLAKLVSTKSCPGCDLTGLNFNRMDLSRVNLEGADLSMSTFVLTNLSYANLKNTVLNGAVFGGADLGDADLTGADLRGVSLDSAYLGGTKMTGEIITTKPFEEIGVDDVEKDVYVEDSSIPKKTPQQKEVKVNERRDFNETPPVLPEVEKGEVVASEEIITVETSSPPETVVPVAPPAKKSNMVHQVTVPVEEEVLLVEDKQSEVSKAQLEKEKIVDESTKEIIPTKEVPKIAMVEVEEIATVEVDEAKLLTLEQLFDTKSCFGCDLSGLSLYRKNLKKADLEKADLTGCNLEKADLRGANLKGAILVGANLKNANLNGADLYKADLSGTDLSGATLENTSYDGAIIGDAIGLDVPLMLQN